MQAIIMAAGKGSRLGKLTEDKPKSFLEIKGEKLIERNVRMLKQYGINDIVIVIGYRDQDFVELFKNVPGIRFVYNPYYEFVNVLGSFWLARKEVSDDFIYLHADTLCEKSIFEELLSHEGDIVLPVDMKPCDDEAMKVKLNDKAKVIEITKQMDCKDAAGEFIGFAKIKKEVIPMLQEKSTELLRNKAYTAYFEAAIQEIINSNQYDIQVMNTDGRFWAEIDFIEDYERACKLIPSE